MMTQVKPAPGQNLPQLCEAMADRAVAASRSMATLGGAARTGALLGMATLLERSAAQIAAANALDIARAADLGLTAAMTDRLRVAVGTVAKMAASVRQIASQVDPVGQLIEGYVRPNGLRIEKVRVPLGVVLIIYESRPNVTCDAAAPCRSEERRVGEG